MNKTQIGLASIIVSTLMGSSCVGDNYSENSYEEIIYKDNHSSSGDNQSEEIWPGETQSEENNFTTIKTGTTSQEGNLFFVDSQEPGRIIKISVKDNQSQENLNNVKITFVDGKTFDAFTLIKDNYVSHFEVFPVESILENEVLRNFKLSSSNYKEVTIFNYYFNENSKKYNAFEDYKEWAKEEEGYAYVKCVDKKESDIGQKFIGIILNLMSNANPFFSVLSFAYDYIGSNKYVTDKLEKPAYDVYEPLNFTGYPLIEEMESCTNPDGNSSSGGDQDCVDECGYEGQKGCIGIENGITKYCGNNDNDNCLEWINSKKCEGDTPYCFSGVCTNYT